MGSLADPVKIDGQLIQRATFAPTMQHRRMSKARASAKKVTKEERLNLDGWANVISGLGSARMDKRLANRMVVVPVGTKEARAIYRGSDMGARAVESRPKEMWRPGFDVIVKSLARSADDDDEDDTGKAASTQPIRSPWTSPLPMPTVDQADSDELKQLAKRAMKKWRKLKGPRTFRRAQAFAGAYGGGAVLVGYLDGQTWDKQLDKARITDIKFLKAFERDELTPIAWYTTFEEGKFGEPMMYQLTPKNARGGAPIVYVHESRLIVFNGVIVSNENDSCDQWWGDSLYTRAKQVMSDFDLGFASVGIMLQEFSIAVMKIKELANAATSTDGLNKILARMAAFNAAKSMANVALIDADNEEFGRVPIQASGVGDLLQALMQRLAACFDQPVTVLMGMSPAGLNATGASDIRQWYDDIAAERKEQLDDPLQELFCQILRLQNGGIEPAEWCIEWRPMWEKDPKQEADIFKTYAEADEINIRNGQYTADEARKSRYGSGEGFGTHIVIDQDDADYTATAEEMAEYKATDLKAPTDPTKPAAVMPTDPTAPNMQPTGAAKVADQAMNGAQITSLIEVVTQVNSKAISRESGLAILKLAFLVDDAQATALLGPETFEPVKPDPPPAPFGGGGAPPKPPAPDKPIAPAAPDKPEPPKPPDETK